MRVTFAVSNVLTLVSDIVGWLYFVSWSVSFYPQIYDNFRRRSVVGLNFDYVGLNIIGYIMYTIFNAGLFWIPGIQEEYLTRHPTGLNPVLANDVGFGLHGIVATLIIIGQCLIYEVTDHEVIS